MLYSVDLRDRATGNSVETILITNDYDAAWNLRELWNRKHVPDYEEFTTSEIYIGAIEEGLIAELYNGGCI